jgi:hypothetical protein
VEHDNASALPHALSVPSNVPRETARPLVAEKNEDR